MGPSIAGAIYPPALSEIAERTEARIDVLLAAEVDRWAAVDAGLKAPLDALRDLVRAGGKRLRPAFCFCAFVGAALRSTDVGGARRIATYKSAKYTVERPLHLGAAVAGRLDELAGPLSAIGLPLGEAFQLRDDILGVFGEERMTGKPVGDDLR